MVWLFSQYHLKICKDWQTIWWWFNAAPSLSRALPTKISCRFCPLLAAGQQDSMDMLFGFQKNSESKFFTETLAGPKNGYPSDVCCPFAACWPIIDLRVNREICISFSSMRFKPRCLCTKTATIRKFVVQRCWRHWRHFGHFSATNESSGSVTLRFAHHTRRLDKPNQS